MSVQKLRFAIIGCGRISERHITALKNLHEYIQISALCDSDRNALQQARDFTGAVPQLFDNYEELLSSQNIDVVSLCTPSGLHSKQACLAAQARKHVVTEKPMATNLKDGIKMVEECERHGVRLFVVKQNRLNPTVQALKHAIDSGRFGKIYSVTCNVFWCRPQSYYEQSPWRGTWALDGGAFMNQASHYVDLLTWLIGSVGSVFAYTGTLARQIEAEDSGSVVLRWTCGAIGSMNVTMLVHDKNYEGSITVIGERGTVKLGGLAANEIVTWDFVDNINGESDSIMKLSYPINSVYGNSHLAYYENVVKSLRGEDMDHVSGNEGLRSLALLDAIYVSARTGQPVHPENL